MQANAPNMMKLGQNSNNPGSSSIHKLRRLRRMWVRNVRAPSRRLWKITHRPRPRHRGRPSHLRSSSPQLRPRLLRPLLPRWHPLPQEGIQYQPRVTPRQVLAWHRRSFPGNDGRYPIPDSIPTPDLHIIYNFAEVVEYPAVIFHLTERKVGFVES